jgi:hypothetical protein
MPALGKRYTSKEKFKVIDFIKKYDAKHGRGGMNQASKKFKIAPLTIRAWMGKRGQEVKDFEPDLENKYISKKKIPSAKLFGLKGKVINHVNNIENYSKQIAELQASIEIEKAAISKELA